MRFLGMAAFTGLCLSACSTGPATQVLVWFEVEAGSAVEGRMAAARVRVFDADGRTALDDTRPIGEVPMGVVLPASVSLVPARRGSTRRFRVEVVLLDAAMGEIARQRAEGAFVPGERVELRLRFTDVCAAVACPFGRTCIEGSCVRACLAPGEDGAPSVPAPCPCDCACAGDQCVEGRCVPRTPIAAVAAGRAHACAITAAGRLFCWGSNREGQLGVGDTETRDAPAAVALPGPVTAVAAGWRHSCAVLQDGTLHCWGDNALGQLGAGGAMEPAPVAVDLREVELVAAGDGHSCAALTDGGVFCWGENEFGQIGTGTASIGRLPPTEVTAGDASMAGVKSALIAGFGHTCALQSIGRLWCWGRNFDGNLGVGDRDHRAAPVRVLFEDGTEPVWTEVSAGNGWHTCGVENGSLYCFGDPADGRLGIVSPDKVTLPSPVSLPGARAGVAAGVRHTCAFGEGGTLICFGTSASGELGVGELAPSDHGPVELADGGWTAAALGESYSCALRDDGALHCFGANDAGQLGLGDREPRNVPVRVCFP
jgi:alpha-tubulin suppressor-like RCC1 family protein